VGGETRREKSLRIGVHHAKAVVWGPVYRTRLSVPFETTRRGAGRGGRAPVGPGSSAAPLSPSNAGTSATSSSSEAAATTRTRCPAATRPVGEKVDILRDSVVVVHRNGRQGAAAAAARVGSPRRFGRRQTAASADGAGSAARERTNIVPNDDARRAVCGARRQRRSFVIDIYDTRRLRLGTSVANARAPTPRHRISSLARRAPVAMAPASPRRSARRRQGVDEFGRALRDRSPSPESPPRRDARDGYTSRSASPRRHHRRRRRASPPPFERDDASRQQQRGLGYAEPEGCRDGHDDDRDDAPNAHRADGLLRAGPRDDGFHRRGDQHDRRRGRDDEISSSKRKRGGSPSRSTRAIPEEAAAGSIPADAAMPAEGPGRHQALMPPPPKPRRVRDPIVNLGWTAESGIAGYRRVLIHHTGPRTTASAW